MHHSGGLLTGPQTLRREGLLQVLFWLPAWPLLFLDGLSPLWWAAFGSLQHMAVACFPRSPERAPALFTGMALAPAVTACRALSIRFVPGRTGRSTSHRASDSPRDSRTTADSFVTSCMPGKRPQDRPTKVCAVCGRPFQWRRKWKQVWDEVRYCSERCRRQRNRVPTNELSGAVEQ